MKYQIDVLLGGILLSVLMTALTPARTTSLSLGGGPTAFSEAYLLSSAGGFPSQPAPEAFQDMGRLGRIVVGQYTVRPKDTLSGLAKQFGSGADYLRSTNQIESGRLSPGNKITVHNGLGMLHQVGEVKGRVETLREVARRYGKSAEKIARANRLPGVALLSDAWLQPGAVLFIPEARLRFTDYVIPVDWARGKRLISSGFGYRRHPVLRYRRFHTGLDMPRPHGFPVKASREGVIVFAGWREGFGRLVIIKHAGGLRTWYGHLSKIAVASGDRVKKAEFIGRVGSSGLSTGPHLHFEVRDKYGNSLNPKKFLF